MKVNNSSPIYIITAIIQLIFISVGSGFAQSPADFSRQDTLRGSLGSGRTGWDVLHYDITVQPDFMTTSIKGKNTITFSAFNNEKMQLDLQEPMFIDSIICEKTSCPFSREKNVYWVDLPQSRALNKKRSIDIYFHGTPRRAVNPPWDGGWVWQTDSLNTPWMSVACQEVGASVWYPCKDIQSDKPDSGATLRIIVPDSLTGVGNGRLKSATALPGRRMEYVWEIKNPINAYNIVPYIGKYAHFSESFTGLKGTLDMDYWVLDYHLNQAKNHLTEAQKTLSAFEYWMGPYPFYEDGYKLVEAPYLGMEHQSGIAYGNRFKNGYLGRDLSGSGWGMKWDFIIVHESGHEWFGNSITSKDIADMWIHEGFTNYSEALYTDFWYGKNASNEYAIGLRRNIENDKPVIGPYGVNKEGSDDMYYKGANLLHLIRQLINNDSLFRELIIGLNKKFYHSTVTSAEVEKFIIDQTGIKLKSVFDQYLRTTKIPLLEYTIRNNGISYRWKNTVANLYLPIAVYIGSAEKKIWITPTERWQKISTGGKINPTQLKVDENFYVRSAKVD